MAGPDDLRVPWPVWWRLLRELKHRGGGVRESGAFLLGRRNRTASTVSKLMFYDDLDPGALATGIVRLSGHAMGAVWDACERAGLEVLADVHTHPAGTGQSASDRENPMIATRGHIALIVPDLAQRTFRLRGIGHYRYRGARLWDVLASPRPGLLHITFGGRA